MESNKPVAIVLGGTDPHVKLIENLKNRNYYTVLVDYLDDSPALKSADQHIQESTLDKERVLDIAKNRNAKLVISTCIDQANVTACYVGEKLDLSIPYSYDTALKVTNKIKMKEIFKEFDIPTASFVFYSDLFECEKISLKFPLIVKPADSNSSKGVVKVNNIDELKKNLTKAIEISRTNQAIVEEYIEGIEIAFDTIVSNGKVNLILSRERCKLENTEGENQQISGSIWPARITTEIENQYKIIIEKICKAFQLDNTPLMIQSIYDGKNIYVLEFAPRIGGGDNYNIIQNLTGCNIIDIAIDSFLHNKMVVEFKQPDKFYFDNYLYVKSCKFGKILNIDKLVKNKVVEYYRVYKNTGTEIGSELSSNNRVGVITISGNNIEEINQKRKVLIKTIDIIDINGNSVFRKDLYSIEDIETIITH